jgi:phage protein D
VGITFDQQSELVPVVRIIGPDGKELDLAGLEQIKVRLQINAADELEAKLPAQYMDGTWRSDMPVWIAGSTLTIEAGYNYEYELLQKFEVVSTTTDYDDKGNETMTVRGVSDLARASRNKQHRTYPGPDSQVIDAICTEYGWTNGVTAELGPSQRRLKENGKSDLEMLRRIAREAVIGGPRLTKDNVLVMPEPEVGDLRYARGVPSKFTEYRRLHSIQVNREAGAFTTRVVVIAWDPDRNQFVEMQFEADEFTGDPKIVYTGKLATKELRDEATTQGLVLAVVDYKGEGKNERVDVISSGRFLNETDAESLARRWFTLREKLSRWSKVTVDGNSGLLPYVSFEIDGRLAAMDRGVWLPTVVEHIFDAKGWRSELKAIRVVDEAVVTPA